MLKRIIFDLDNTLIEWKEEYNDSIKEAYKHFGIELTELEYLDFDRKLRLYENEKEYFKEDIMMNFFNKLDGIKMPDGFIKVWIEKLSKKIPEDYSDLDELLKYLSSKYELVVLTNWYTESQLGRLKNMNLDKYFKEVIGSDIVKMKPNEEAFRYAMGDNDVSECLMVGDNLEIDLETPNKLGMKTILVTDKDIKYKNKIKKITELKEML